MTVRVRLFARLRDLAGAEALAVELPEGATAGELRAAIVGICPALRELLPRCAVAVDGEFADDNAQLRRHSEVALIPPVSGG